VFLYKGPHTMFECTGRPTLRPVITSHDFQLLFPLPLVVKAYVFNSTDIWL